MIQLFAWPILIVGILTMMLAGQIIVYLYGVYRHNKEVKKEKYKEFDFTDFQNKHFGDML